MTNNNISEDKNKNLGKIDLHAELVETGVEQVLIDLDKSLIGLEPVKTRIRETAALLLVEKAREKLGLAHETPTLHMSFQEIRGPVRLLLHLEWLSYYIS